MKSSIMLATSKVPITMKARGSTLGSGGEEMICLSVPAQHHSLDLVLRANPESPQN